MRLILAIALLLAPTALIAGQRATFTAKDDPKTLVVTLADNGDVRIEGSGEKEYGLRVGGIFYLVQESRNGLTVARASDLSAAVKKAIPSEMRQLFGELGKGAPKSSVKITPKGEKTINGRTGRLYEISGLGGSKAAEFVMSEDPALKPFGENLSAYVSAVTAPAMVLFGPMMEGLLADMQKVFALGTPLDADGKFILTTVETVETNPADFRLPAEPMSVDALAASFAEKGKNAASAPDIEAVSINDSGDDATEATADDITVEMQSDADAMDAAADAVDAAMDATQEGEPAEDPQ